MLSFNYIKKKLNFIKNRKLNGVHLLVTARKNIDTYSLQKLIFKEYFLNYNYNICCFISKVILCRLYNLELD